MTDIVDVHTHFVPDRLPEIDDESWPRPLEEGGKRFLVLPGGRRRVVPRTAHDMRARLADMDRIGVRRHIMSPMPALLADVLTEPGSAVAAARAVNDALATSVAVDPERLGGLGTLPVTSVEAMKSAVEHGMSELGLLGFELSGEGVLALIHSGTWSDACALLRGAGAVVLVHPHDDSLGRRRDLTGRLAIGGVAMLAETAFVALEIMRAGVTELPPLVLAHGGGAVPYALDRIDALWRLTDAKAELDEPPSLVYRRTFAVDTAVQDPEGLRLAASKVDPGRVLFGSDYPFAIMVDPSVVPRAALDADDVFERSARALGLGG